MSGTPGAGQPCTASVTGHSAGPKAAATRRWNSTKSPRNRFVVARLQRAAHELQQRLLVGRVGFGPAGAQASPRAARLDHVGLDALSIGRRRPPCPARSAARCPPGSGRKWYSSLREGCLPSLDLALARAVDAAPAAQRPSRHGVLISERHAEPARARPRKRLVSWVEVGEHLVRPVADAVLRVPRETRRTPPP